MQMKPLLYGRNPVTGKRGVKLVGKTELRSSESHSDPFYGSIIEQ